MVDQRRFSTKHLLGLQKRCFQSTTRKETAEEKVHLYGEIVRCLDREHQSWKRLGIVEIDADGTTRYPHSRFSMPCIV